MSRIKRPLSSFNAGFSSEEDEAIEIEEDSSTEIGDRISVTLRNGTIAEFREPTAEDIIQLRKSGITDETELVARIATRCCISWGDKEGVALPTILKLGIRDFKNISDNLNSFLSPN